MALSIKNQWKETSSPHCRELLMKTSGQLDAHRLFSWDTGVYTAELPWKGGTAPTYGNTAVQILLGCQNLGTIDIWGRIILCCGGCFVYCRVSCSIPELSSCQQHKPTLVVTTKNDFRHRHMSPWGQKSPLVENHWMKLIKHGLCCLHNSFKTSFA